LLGAYVASRELPVYAPAFALSRYDDKEYVSRLDTWGETGQL
jgi:hypothetical protein